MWGGGEVRNGARAATQNTAALCGAAPAAGRSRARPTSTARCTLPSTPSLPRAPALLRCLHPSPLPHHSPVPDRPRRALHTHPRPHPQLRVYKGNLSEFVKAKPEAKAYYELTASTLTFKLPEPGYLEGVKTKDKAILKADKVGSRGQGFGVRGLGRLRSPSGG